ncbi:MAG TPA: Tm-1-like ATP-binding domain-containing protein [Syntrophorhabdales bacterium]|nr:Tm-1-like ATP-binding domain-containing protein [Syntrophorhabdales bacterium]
MAVVIVGMLDEREEALKVIKEQIEKRGHRTLLADITVGTGALVPSLKADVTSGELLELAKVSGALGADALGTALMAEGLKRKVMALSESGELEGIIAITGMTGALISLEAMKALPFGVPKLLITSSASMPAHAEQYAGYLAFGDITVMHAMIDTVGMNSLVRTLAINGANAVSGMVEGRHLQTPEKRLSAAITEFGFCEKGAHFIRRILEEEYEVVSIHSNGLGDQAAVGLVRQGYFAAFVDLVPGAYSEYLLGGNRASGPDRLDIAADQPIPYILCPGGFDMISCGPLERREKGDPLWVSRRLGERKLHVQDAFRVQARTSIEEMRQIASAVSERLNRYILKARVKVVIPLRGFSVLSAAGGELYDPEADLAFTESLKKQLDPEIEVIEVAIDINSPEFADVVTGAVSKCLSALR